MSSDTCLTEFSLLSDMAIMELAEEGSFGLIGTPPEWLERFFPEIIRKRQAAICYDDSPFLDQFLRDAEAFWNAGVEGKLKSGVWLETDAGETECPFEATAVLSGNRKFLMIKAAQHSHDEKQEIIQKGRELALAYHRLEQTEAELREAKKNAENASRSKSDFLTDMSHEFRTPLNAISGYVRILMNHPSATEFQLERLEIIRKSTEHLLRLINDTLDISKIEAGRLELEPSDFSLSRFLNDLVGMFRVQAERKQIRFSYQAPNGLPKVMGDERRLRQVMINLLGNAIKFTDKGSVMLNAEYGDGQVCFEVRDTGPGIASGDMEKIFSPFHQTGSYPKMSEGTGLGLSISKKLVKMMGGELTVRSTPGQGTIFRVKASLPLAESDTDISGAEISETPQVPIIPPIRSELSELTKLAYEGNIKAIRQRAEILSRMDEQLVPFAEELICLAKEFRMGKIRSFLKSFPEGV
jgi:signal transduction histidine kinase